MANLSVSFAGAGKVSGALCRSMHDHGISIRQIVSETPSRGMPLAARYKASWSSELDFSGPVDLIIVSVPDHRLKEVLGKIKCPPGTPVVHTAGSFGLELFPSYLKQSGVFYPLQTFTAGRRIDLKNLPFFIEASTPELSDMLTTLTLTLGGKVYSVDAGHRRLLHLAAVFVCNFVNHMLTSGKEITGKAGLSFDIMEPLIRETVAKALKNGPENSQTGPAVRNDRNTVEKHLDLLSFSPDLKRVYQEVTRSITEHYKNTL